MLVTLLLMVSAALIGAGAALLLRDWLQKARAPFVGDAPLSRTIRLAPEEAQITIARTNAAPREETHAVEVDVPRPVSPAKPVLRVAAPPAQPEEIERTERMLVRHDEISQATAPEPDPGPKSGPDTGSDPASDPGSDPGPVPEPEPRTVPVTTPLVSDRADLWQHLLLALDGAVARANTRLAGREISVGLRRVPMAESGAPAEQGATFPILVAGRREAWLRLERDSEGHIVARVTALASRGLAEPQPEQRQLPEGASDPDLDAMLDACLLPLAPRALPMDDRRVPAAEIRMPTPVAAVPRPSASAPLHNGDGTLDGRLASEHAWRSTESTLLAALRATNRGLAQVDTRLVELATPQWEPAQQRHRLQLALVVSGNEVARVHIDRRAHEFEIAVAGTAGGMREFGRRRRVPVDGVTVQSLAELIAACVWPTVTRVRDKRPGTGPA